jgi:putative selenium metabolism hydrolase
MDFLKIHKYALDNTPAAAHFLKNLIAIPSLTCREHNAIKRTAEEMKKCGFEQITIDPMGNLIGKIGSGSHIIAMDAHIDTVDIGNRKNWKNDPFSPVEKNGIIYGRGAADMKGSVAALIYAGKIIKEKDLLDNCTLYVTITVQEEDCEGLCWQYIFNEDKIKPDVVLICEPSNLHLIRGHKGRAEFEISVEGVASHGSEPDRGINAIYQILPVIEDIKKLNKELPSDPFLGNRTITVTHIQSTAPSLNAVPDFVKIFVDRRLTHGETRESILDEIIRLQSVRDCGANVTIPEYVTPSYTGLTYSTVKYFPTWSLDEEHTLVHCARDLYEKLYSQKTDIKKWNFSTNGVATAGLYNIPTFGFGPANPIYAHTTEDQCPIHHLTEAIKFYAVFPLFYVQNYQ